MNHQDLCQAAVRWLERPQSRSGPGCHFAIREPRCGWLDGEIPDAIGIRCGVVDTEWSVVVEVKVTRADFLADLKKPHRGDSAGGMGRFRYFMAPAGLIKVEELPPRWGLVEVTPRGVMKVRAGHVLMPMREDWTCDYSPWEHARNLEREWSMLARLVMKVGDPDKTQQRIREVQASNTRLATANAGLSEELRTLSRKAFRNERLVALPAVQKAIAEVLGPSGVEKDRPPVRRRPINDNESVVAAGPVP